MNKLVIAAAFSAVSVLGFAAPVFADSPGQLANNVTNYEVRNVTQNGAYAQNVSATCNETVKYSITAANAEFGMLKNLTVKANLASGTMNVSATNAADATTAVSGTATVSLAKGSLVYVPGSTVRITSDGKTTSPLADGITAGGVNVGQLTGSTDTFIQFQAKVDCPTPPTPVKIEVCELATKNKITINESDFDASKHSRDLNKCAPAQPGDIKVCVIATKEIVTIKENAFDASKHTKDLNVCNKVPTSAKTAPVAAPAVIASTGPAGTLAAMFSLSALAAAATYFVRSRNLLG